jgi:hypothetical protein
MTRQRVERSAAGSLVLMMAVALLTAPAMAAAQDERRLARLEDDDQARERADEAREREEQARERAEQARERAEQERERAENARERERDRAENARERERDRAENAYERGQRAIERAEWASAAEQFAALAKAGAARADAALYWRAYALDKLNRQADALTTVAELIKGFPMSRWLSDARALEMQVRQRAGQPVSPDAQSDDDLKLLAIQALQHSAPEQAVPMLEKLLQGNQSPRLKERALFVLAQSGSPRARQVITGIARGGSNPDLQQKAIQYLGMNGNAANRQALGEIYASSSDLEIKRRILRAFMMSGDKEHVLSAATTEKSPELRAEGVRLLGMMGARDELWQLYQKESSIDVKQQILQGMMMSGDVTHMIEIANTEPNMDLRRRAVQQLGMTGSTRTGETLVNLYARQTEPSIRNAVIDALFIQGNAESLVALARKETDRTMQRRMVEKLSLMNRPAATNYLMEILNK